MIKEKVLVESYYVLALACALQMNFLVAHYADLCSFSGHRAGIFLSLVSGGAVHRETHTQERQSRQMIEACKGKRVLRCTLIVAHFAKTTLNPLKLPIMT